MKRLKNIVIVFLMAVILTGCNQEVVLDYGDATAFESALNEGENLEGKTVQFEAMEIHPDSASGYNIWAGEHLNFISSRNPDIKSGDIVTVRATEIESALGSWLIKYEKIDDAQIGDTTILSGQTDNSDANNINQSNANTAYKADSIPVENSTIEKDEEKPADDASLEAVDAGIVAFNGYFGDPKVSAYFAFRNISDVSITLRDVRIEYQDDDGKLLTVDDMANCIPSAVKPGQIGYIYSYYHSLDGIDLSNGLRFEPDAQVYEAKTFYEIGISDASFKEGSGLGIEVTARGTNNSGKDRSLAEPGAIFFDKDGNVMGFCYGFEEFLDGQTKAFNISGDLLSEDYKASDVDHIEIYIQGNDW